MRTNIGFAEFDGIPTTVEVTLFDNTSVSLRAINSEPKRYTVDGMGWSQPSRLFTDILGADGVLRAGSAMIKIVDGGLVYIYASKIDNRTGDPTFIPAQNIP